MIIDAKNAIAGRLASAIARKLLLGEKITIINAELALITGNPLYTKSKYIDMRERGSPFHGPFFPKKPELILKRIIRGMLPYKKPKGRNAMRRLKVYIGFPKSMEGKHIMIIEQSSREIKSKYMTLATLAKTLGWNPGTE
ncbi:MAG: 50S ribosomal protein L13 [Candidatus Aenigmatarchaeota archaeon]